jgi:N-sulfoglucosamine sulfohydrolase
LMASAALAVNSGTPPNIVLIVAEDLSPRIGAFGDSVAQTPNIDELAQQGVRFDRVFSAAGVCAPNRSALITGVYPQSLGTQHMRTSTKGYQAVPGAEVKAFPELLRKAGYVTANTAKTDYQFGEPFTIWDINHGGFSQPPDLALWRQLPGNTPFFAMINLMSTHESRLATPQTQGQGPLGAMVTRLVAAREAAVAKVTDPATVQVPDYYPDVPQVRQSIAQHYDNVHFMDAQVGQVLANLRQDGLLDSTVVIWTTDHGDGLPRAKRSVYDSGLHIPLILRLPGEERAGQVDSRLISMVDLAPSVLALAGIQPPDFIQGRALLTADESQQYVFAGRDRMDSVPDYVRAVRDQRYKYIRNYLPDLAYYRPLTFRDMFPVMQALWLGNAAGTLTPQQQFYFDAPRPAEELYDLQEDPQELVNLAGRPSHQDTLKRLSQAMDQWLADVGDTSSMAEEDMMEAMWPGGQQPQTQPPAFQVQDQRLLLSSATPGASIAYRVSGGDAPWVLYSGPIPWPASQQDPVEAKAVRYGYQESSVVTFGLTSKPETVD